VNGRTPKNSLLFIDEPLLQFGHGQKMVYPRDGLFLYGPSGNIRELPSVRVGVIGTTDGVERFNRWSARIRKFIPIPPPTKKSKEIQAHHVPFPGFAEAFRADWPATPTYSISDLSGTEIDKVMRIGNRHEAVRTAVDMYVNRLIDANNRLEHPPAFWFVVIPEIVYRLGRPRSVVGKSDRVAPSVSVSLRRAKQLESEPTLFGAEEEQASVYKYANHFRRQLKARLLKDKIVTQIARETTLTPEDFVSDAGWPMRRVEDAATIAWKLCTGSYYKAGGRPWHLANVRKGVCYVGLVYKRTELTSDASHACCAAQMFLSDGEGVVFRGALGPWYQTDTKQFHLDSKAAADLIRNVVNEYSRTHDEKPPSELFIHARSEFSEAEWEGFKEACPTQTNLVAVQVRDGYDDLKLFRTGAYPVIRGTALKITKSSAYLWTSGFVPRLATYMGPETPNPIFVKVHKGECDFEVVLRDVMGLTKINFNTCLHNDRMPVTIRFANQVGDVLNAAPIESEPRLPFKYYI
jgi:hypothetical protein